MKMMRAFALKATESGNKMLISASLLIRIVIYAALLIAASKLFSYPGFIGSAIGIFTGPVGVIITEKRRKSGKYEDAGVVPIVVPMEGSAPSRYKRKILVTKPASMESYVGARRYATFKRFRRVKRIG
jgi:hypothetical protein